jgi:hypothetical protein
MEFRRRRLAGWGCFRKFPYATPRGESYQRGRALITGDHGDHWARRKRASSGRQGTFLAEWALIASRALIIPI